MPRPVLIDPADGPCETCAGWSKARAARPHGCATCGNDIPLYLNMGRAGFQTPAPDHYHLTADTGLPGRAGIYPPGVCWDCYAKVYAALYPGLPLPRRPQLIEMPDELDASRLPPPVGTIEEFAE